MRDEEATDFACEIRNAPPLPAAEERELSRRLRELRIAAYGHDGAIDKDTCPVIDSAAFCDYEKVREALANSLGHVATKAAKMYWEQGRKGLGFADLYQEGFVAIMKAIDKHEFRDIKSACANKRMRCGCGTVFIPKKKGDVCPNCMKLGLAPTKNAPFCGHVIDCHGIKVCPKCGDEMGSPVFSGFVADVVANDVFRFIDKNNRTIRLPSHIINALFVNLHMRCKDCGAVFVEKNKTHRCPKCNNNSYEQLPIDELAKELNCSMNNLEAARRDTVSLDSSTNEDSPLTNMIAAENRDGGTINRIRSLIYRALVIMAKKREHFRRMATIIRDAYITGMTYDEIGKKYGFTKQRAKQMVTKSMDNLQKLPECFESLCAAVEEMKRGPEAA